LRVIDRKIAAYTADDAAVVVRETVEQINQSGATPDKEAKVQQAMFTLVSNRRRGMSSDAVRKKIARLMTLSKSFIFDGQNAPFRRTGCGFQLRWPIAM